MISVPADALPGGDSGWLADGCLLSVSAHDWERE